MHVSVLSQEVLEYLKPQSGENFIDCTINGGGHAEMILERIKPKGRLLGIEADPEIFKKIKKDQQLITVNSNFVHLKEIVKERNFFPVSGILFDLGFSSWHVDESGKGFSFSKNEFLDMRYSSDGITAWQIVNKSKEQELVSIFKEYGEERFSKIIARRIIERREKETIDTSLQLAEIIEESIPGKFKKGKIHPATRVFQALRIEVNQELENLKEVLPQAVEVLSPKGRIVVISFHSLEDRIVKHFFKNRQDLEILTKKPVLAGEEEINNNMRSRSAKLRAAQKK